MGLPHSNFHLQFDLDATHRQMWENVRAKLRAEHGAGSQVSDEDLLHEMMQMVLSSDCDGSVPGRKSVDGSIYKVVISEPAPDGAGPRRCRHRHH